ncbi:hypothetical protein WR25_24274 isoform B [Diploscapter pachys]|nr:hypothetical protein WR25_24274 isoform B [Diploscapter pachys]
MASSIEDFLEEYSRTLHAPLALVLCISGACGHLITIAILSRMLNPTNAFLISMSCSQLALCVNFLYSTLFKFASEELCQPFFFSYYMAKSMHLSVTLSALVNISAVFHVVGLSLIRYKSLSALANINSTQQWFSYQKFRLIVITIYVSVAVFAPFIYFTSEVELLPEKIECAIKYPELRGQPVYELRFSSNPILQSFTIWLFHLCAKIIPAIILCLMTILILKKLKQIQELSARFATVEREKAYQLTTNFILIIMFMFIIVELPQGLIGILSTVFDVAQFFYHLGDINEMMTLLTSCIIFGCFCLMNGKIRTALLEIFCLKLCRKWTRKAFDKR